MRKRIKQNGNESETSRTLKLNEMRKKTLKGNLKKETEKMFKTKKMIATDAKY